MAKHVFTDGYVSVNAVNLSDHVKEINLTLDKEEVDSTCMGDTVRNFLDSFHTWTCSVRFMQDFAAGEVDATLYPLYLNDTQFTLAIRPTSGAISATNPEYTATARLKTYPPLTGAVGAGDEITVTFSPVTAMVRDVTP